VTHGATSGTPDAPDAPDGRHTKDSFARPDRETKTAAPPSIAYEIPVARTSIFGRATGADLPMMRSLVALGEGLGVCFYVGRHLLDPDG
jgi:hypothetical protein